MHQYISETYDGIQIKNRVIIELSCARRALKAYADSEILGKNVQNLCCWQMQYISQVEASHRKLVVLIQGCVQHIDLSVQNRPHFYMLWSFVRGLLGYLGMSSVFLSVGVFTTTTQKLWNSPVYRESQDISMLMTRDTLYSYMTIQKS